MRCKGPAEGEEPAPDDTPMAEKIKAAKLEAYTSVIGARLAMLEEEVREKEPDIAEVDTWLTENGLDEEGQQLGCLGLYMTNKAKPEGEAEAPSNGGPGRQVVEQVVNIVTDLELDFIQDKIRERFVPQNDRTAPVPSGVTPEPLDVRAVAAALGPG